MANKTLGDRMKQYEEVTRITLPIRTYTIIRIDGRAFHTFTKKFKRPFDNDFVNMMNETAIALCEEEQKKKIGFVQSDEISIVLTDFDDINTSPWFDGVVQKICSNSASIATEAFNKELVIHLIKTDESCQSDYEILQLVKNNKWAYFDSRVFTIPSPTDVINYLIWRQNDATTNSISSVAQSLYSHKQLHEKNQAQQQEMIFQKGINWNDLDDGLKRGRIIVKDENGKWVIKNPPIFSKDWDYLKNIIPNYD